MNNAVTLLVQLLIGLLFGSGLVISGMSNPEKVLNFLDVAAIASGTWDPSLILVLGGGIAVTLVGYRLAFTRQRPLLDSRFHLSTAKSVDRHILMGGAIFGIGWGLVGFCPGPAFTALGTGSRDAALFVAAMLAGMISARWLAIQCGGGVAEAAKSET